MLSIRLLSYENTSIENGESGAELKRSRNRYGILCSEPRFAQTLDRRGDSVPFDI